MTDENIELTRGEFAYFAVAAWGLGLGVWLLLDWSLRQALGWPGFVTMSLGFLAYGCAFFPVLSVTGRRRGRKMSSGRYLLGWLAAAVLAAAVRALLA